MRDSTIAVPLRQGDSFDRDELINIIKTQIGNNETIKKNKFRELENKEKEIYENIKSNAQDYKTLSPNEKILFWTKYFNPKLAKVGFLGDTNSENTITPEEAFALIFSSKNFADIFNNADKNIMRHQLLYALFAAAQQTVAKSSTFSEIRSNFKQQYTDNDYEEILDLILQSFFSDATDFNSRKIEINGQNIIIIPEKNRLSGTIKIGESKVNYKITFNEDYESKIVKNLKINKDPKSTKQLKQNIRSALEKDSSISKMKISFKDSSSSYTIASIQGGLNEYQTQLQKKLLSGFQKNNDWSNQEVSLYSIFQNKILSKQGGSTYVQNYLHWFINATQDNRYSGSIPDWYIKNFKKSLGMSLKKKKTELTQSQKNQMYEMWEYEKKIFSVLTESIEDATEISKILFINAVQASLDKMRNQDTKTILLNLGFISKEIPLEIVEEAANYFKDNSGKIINKISDKKGIQLISLMYSNSAQLGAEGEISALLELPKEFESSGQQKDTIRNKNGEVIDLGQSFKDISSEDYGINVKHQLYSDNTINLYYDKLSLKDGQKYLQYKYTDNDTFNIINLYVLNRDDDVLSKQSITPMLIKDITKFMRMEFNGNYCLFYRLSNFYYPASVIYEQCFQDNFSFFSMEYQEKNRLQKMKQQHLKNNTNYVDSYLHDDAYKQNKIVYGLKNLKLSLDNYKNS